MAQVRHFLFSFQEALTAWFCTTTLITCLRFVLGGGAWLIRFTKSKARSINEQSAQLRMHWFAIPRQLSHTILGFVPLDLIPWQRKSE